MNLYDVFGGTLRSELALDQLPPARAMNPDWTLRVVDAAPATTGGEALGSDVVYGDTQVRGYRLESGFSLVFDDTGRFDVSADGSTITWHRPADALLDSALADITSRVLALAIHAAGKFTLHASAVSVNGGGIAFMAPKHHGKSTLCSALVLAGARALSDDTVPVGSGRDPYLSPGLPQMRLWSDAASRLFGLEREESSSLRKHLMDQLDASRIETSPVPFRAAYVLNPVAELADGAAAARDLLDSVTATMSLLIHAKLGPVLTGSESPVMLARAADIARVVPVYALRVVRDLDRLDDVARQLLAWHTVADVADRHA